MNNRKQTFPNDRRITAIKPNGKHYKTWQSDHWLTYWKWSVSKIQITQSAISDNLTNQPFGA